MSRAIFLHIIFFFATLSLCGQVMIERFSISTFSLNGSTTPIEVFSTGGQVACATIGNGNYFFAEGFEQPWKKNPIAAYYHIIFNRCSSTYDIVIDSISGCTSLASATLKWNGWMGDELHSSPNTSVFFEIYGPPGCYYSTTMDLPNEVSGETDCRLSFYNYLSPNGDGKNDQWIIDGITGPKYEKNQVAIINRWGREVWAASNYNNTSVYWDGADAAHRFLPDGTYFYSVKANGEKYSGYIELQR